MEQRHILITGGSGQIGTELSRLEWPAHLSLHFPTHEQLDLTSATNIAAYAAHQDWDVVINCAAWTAVDAAEDNAAAAFLANSQGPAWLAEMSARRGALFIQLSTDYVFSGDLDRAYRETDPTGPTGAYGASKLAGEQAVSAASPRSVILRTAWVVSPHGSNFVKTMLRLGHEREQLSIVNDQIGCPTSARDIAAAIQAITLRHLADAGAPTGIFHFVNSGSASWYEFAQAIFEIASVLGGPNPKLHPIPTSSYPTRAVRPANSRLDIGKIEREFGVVPRDWRIAVREIVDELMTGARAEGQSA